MAENNQESFLLNELRIIEENDNKEDDHRDVEPVQELNEEAEVDERLINELNSVNPKDVKRFSFNGFKTIAKVIKIYDPDTCTILFKCPNSKQLTKLNIRLLGIDAPEKKSKIEAEVHHCKVGTAYLDDLMLNKPIHVHMGEFDKYGRVLSTIYELDDETTSINDKLIEKGLVRKYDGGTKHVWEASDLD